jgi:glycosyltransferase involved in cell wall biosynthesis
MKDAGTASDSAAIEVSVVVPVRNEELSIRALLDGLLNQTLAPKEIIITDGGSTDTYHSDNRRVYRAGCAD